MNQQDLSTLILRDKHERWIDRIIGAVFMAILVMVAIFIIPFMPVALRPPPVDVKSINILTEMPVCPGDIVTFQNTLAVTEPGIIGAWSGILDKETNIIIRGTRQESIPVVRTAVTDLKQNVSFEIPSIPAGEYIRIAGFAAINSDTKPTFVEVPFTVGDKCLEENES